ncbi:hypothetical protein AAVH_06087 [Aphelenchoides avenae]|nr:hypothetical protein AAVH_06087 [Aphelenchus avenae]
MLAHSLTVLLLLVLAAIIVHTGSAQGELDLDRIPIADQLSPEASIDERAIAALFDRDDVQVPQATVSLLEVRVLASWQCAWEAATSPTTTTTTM